ncbi:MAG: hypothetical protein AAGA48_30360 [Myxococcota bacterium]
MKDTQRMGCLAIAVAFVVLGVTGAMGGLAGMVTLLAVLGSKTPSSPPVAVSAPMAEAAEPGVVLTATPEPAPAEKAPTPEPATGISINGRALSQSQVAALTRHYGAAPQPGSWWYDPRSGFFGRMGEPVFGTIQPGHDFGMLKANASKGRSGVFLNGRQLPAAELGVYAMLLGPVQPGRYWLDEQGNVGFEGQSVPVANLLLAAQAAGMASGGNGGSPADKWLSGNEWSGEARIGGMPMTSGTWDTSGGGNHVISVDGEVLTLP